MSNASTTKAKATDPLSPTSPSEAPTQQPRRYSRFTGADVGDRLANARNLHHTQAPPPPPPRAMMGAQDGGIPLSGTTPGYSRTQERYFIPPQGGPKYGAEKGSYRSPYDYNITLGATGGAALRAQATSSFPWPSVFESGFLEGPAAPLQPSTSRLPEGHAYLHPSLPQEQAPLASVQDYQPPADVSLLRFQAS